MINSVLIKRAISIISIIVILANSLLCIDLNPLATTFSGTCGTMANWELDTETCTLKISGTGSLKSYNSITNRPEWYEYREFIKTIIVEEGITKITSAAFASHYNLSEVYIPSTVTSIGSSAFTGDRAITKFSVNVNNNNFSSYEDVLFNKNKTRLIKYPCGNEKLEYTVPSSVTSVDNYAFAYTKFLEKINIGTSLQSMEDNAFMDARSIKSIFVSPDNSFFMSQDDVLFNKTKTKLIFYPTASENQRYEIPNTVVTLTNYSFYYCNNLEELYIGENVSTFESTVFTGCDGLKYITVSEKNESYSSEDGVLFDKNKKALVKYPSSNSRLKYIVPSSVIEIKTTAFKSSENLVLVVVSDNTESISSDAFTNCSNLKYFVVGKGIKKFYASVFSNCNNLTDVYYAGNAIAWEKVEISTTGNSQLCGSACIHYNYEYNESDFGISDSEITEPNTEPSTELSTEQSTESNTESSTEQSIKPSTMQPAVTTVANVTNNTSCSHSSTKNKIIKRADLKEDGKVEKVCTKCGKVVSIEVIKAAKTFYISNSNYTYTGKKLTKPVVTITDADGNIINSSNYSISYISRINNKKVSSLKTIGQYKIKVLFNGEYSGTKYLYFSVKPKKAKIKTLKSKNNSVTANWSAQRSITGYQIIIATDSEFTKNKKTVTINKKSATSQKIKGLKKGKRYYVKIRSFKNIKVEGKKACIYSDYSSVKSFVCK